MDSIADLLATRPVTPAAGASGYFSAPADHLDPNLFGRDERVHRQVRVLILSTLYSYWRSRWSEPQAWSTVYLAGSGASYQWSADRSDGSEPGDLDILIDVDWTQFYAHQSGEIKYLPPLQVADVMDTELKAALWPKTAELHIGRGVYEATFYVNPDPITSIRPYAAYNLSEDRWLVHPDPNPQHPQGPEDYGATQADHDRADEIVTRYNSAVELLHRHPVNSPEWVNARAEIHWASERAGELFSEIHGARSTAFSPEGEGYSDNANFRWQAAKQNGTIDNLTAIVGHNQRAGSSWVKSANDILLQRALQARQP